MPASDPSIDPLLARLQDGDEAAATAVFDRFARRLIGLARTQLDAHIRRKVDAEDVVQSVFRSFFARAREHEFALKDWDNLWSLLALITVRKCTNVRVRFHRKGRDVQLEVAADNEDRCSANWTALDREPTPAEAAVLRELVERLLASLSDRDRQIVAMCLEGKDASDIAAEIGRAERTVRRTLDGFRLRLKMHC